MSSYLKDVVRQEEQRAIEIVKTFFANKLSIFEEIEKRTANDSNSISTLPILSDMLFHEQVVANFTCDRLVGLMKDAKYKAFGTYTAMVEESQSKALRECKEKERAAVQTIELKACSLDELTNSAAVGAAKTIETALKRNSCVVSLLRNAINANIASLLVADGILPHAVVKFRSVCQDRNGAMYAVTQGGALMKGAFDKTDQGKLRMSECRFKDRRFRTVRAYGGEMLALSTNQELFLLPEKSEQPVLLYKRVETFEVHRTAKEGGLWVAGVQAQDANTNPSSEQPLKQFAFFVDQQRVPRPELDISGAQIGHEDSHKSLVYAVGNETAKTILTFISSDREGNLKISRSELSSGSKEAAQSDKTKEFDAEKTGRLVDACMHKESNGLVVLCQSANSSNHSQQNAYEVIYFANFNALEAQKFPKENISRYSFELAEADRELTGNVVSFSVVAGENAYAKTSDERNLWLVLVTKNCYTFCAEFLLDGGGEGKAAAGGAETMDGSKPAGTKPVKLKKPKWSLDSTASLSEKNKWVVEEAYWDYFGKLKLLANEETDAATPTVLIRGKGLN